MYILLTISHRLHGYLPFKRRNPLKTNTFHHRELY